MSEDSSKTIDLAAEFNKSLKGLGSQVAAQYLASFEIDLSGPVLALATAWADDMRENLSTGMRPDGKAEMRKREGDRMPRGWGTATAASISVRWSKAINRLVIGADETERGALGRILRGIPFRPPVTSPRIAAALKAAPQLAMIHGAAVRRRGQKWSPKRLAQWKAWQATQKK